MIKDSCCASNTPLIVQYEAWITTGCVVFGESPININANVNRINAVPMSTDPEYLAKKRPECSPEFWMTTRTNRSALLRASFLVTIAGLFLASCSKNPEVETEGPKSQIVAKIGDQVITIQELDNEFRLSNVQGDMRKDPATIKRVLGEMVTRKYLVKQALDAKLDREPTVLLDILRSKELVLASAVVSRDVTTKTASISKGDIDNYIANNPLKFAGRNVLSVEEISVPLASMSQAILDSTKEMKSLDEVDQKLTALGVQHGRSTGAISSGDLPQDLADKVAANQPDNIFFIRAAANGIFFKVLGQEAKPLDGEAAISAARNYLRQDIFKTQIGMTSISANLATKYEGDYSDIMAKEAGASELK
jgi:EpsD family peptidyl-prolyl cis-trans isomerase